MGFSYRHFIEPSTLASVDAIRGLLRSLCDFEKKCQHSQTRQILFELCSFARFRVIKTFALLSFTD